MVPQCGWFRKSQVHTRNIRFVFCHRSKSLFLFSVFFTFNVSEIFELFTFHSFILYFFMFTASLAFWSGECDGGDCWLLPGITVVVLLLYFLPARDVVDHKQFEITWIVLTVVRAVLGNTVQIRSSQCIYMCVWSSCATQELQPDAFVLGPVDRLSTRLSLKNDRSKKIELEDFLQKTAEKRKKKGCSEWDSSTQPWSQQFMWMSLIDARFRAMCSTVRLDQLPARFRNGHLNLHTLSNQY